MKPFNPVLARSKTMRYALQQNRRNFSLIISTIAIAAAAGVLILIKLPWLDFLTRISYTIFDFALIMTVIVTIVLVVSDLLSKDFAKRTTINQN